MSPNTLQKGKVAPICRNQFFVFRPELRRKLFRLKNLGDVQDTEQNGDESQFKVRPMHTMDGTLRNLLFTSVCHL